MMVGDSIIIIQKYVIVSTVKKFNCVRNNNRNELRSRHYFPPFFTYNIDLHHAARYQTHTDQSLYGIVY